MYAYYKAMPSSNPLITEKMQQRKVAKHKEKLKKVTCSVDNKPPKNFRAMPRRNPKKEQMQEERFAAIERDNRLLIEKMARIMSEKGSQTLGAPNVAPSLTRSRSLHCEFRKREMDRITRANRQILDRLERTGPTYSTVDWERERKRNEKIMRQLMVHKPPPSAHGRARHRPGSPPPQRPSTAPADPPAG
mmetsp:Transcript_14286/g.45795  ORF Transcript_14286/g.45795 Transcript_14286/m.45795 type:complete len:190 (-) Transcript_14286:147-716(-)